MESYKPLFEQAYEKPAQDFLQRKALPGIQESFSGENSRESSALNEAMAQAAADVSSMVGQQAGQFYQNQQAGQQNVMQMIMQMMQSPEFQPYLQQNSGWLPMFIELAGKGVQGAAGRM